MRKYGVDERLAGRRAECEGGGPVAVGGATRVLGGRENFSGRLTGLFFEDGDPPWVWYQMGDLDQKPEGYSEEFVWCEATFLFVLDEE